MSAHKFYQIRCEAPGCKASKVGQVNETPSRMRRKKDGWVTGIHAQTAFQKEHGIEPTARWDRCPDHAPA